jgi:hypothetical protein
MTRARPMPAYYCRSAIRAEVRRAARAGRSPDPVYLSEETGLAWPEVERGLTAARRELAEKDSAAVRIPASGGGAISSTGSPASDPFAPPKSKGKASQ